MKEWMKIKTNKALFVLAVASFAIITVEGLVYFSSYEEVLFRVLLILENTLKAFTFKATISLESARDFMLKDPTPFKTVLSYLYMLCIFTAPYCTIATVYKLLERVLKFTFWLHRSSVCENVVVFGYNDAVRHLMRNADGKKQRTHVICGNEPSEEERYLLVRNNVKLHMFDLTKARDAEVKSLLKGIDIDKAAKILLMEESSIRNFSLLQALGNDAEIRLAEGVKVFCRCEDEGIGRLIENYYDTADAGAKRSRFDLEIIDLPKLQVRSMYADKPLHACRLKAPEEVRKDPASWRTHLLIIGFGRVGQQALLQAMNLGVSHSENPIVIDVIDKDVDKNRDLFFNHFGEGAFIEDAAHAGEFSINPAWTDGSLLLRFHAMDVRYGAFRRKLRQLCEGEAGLFTYVVCAIDQADAGIHSISEIWRFLHGTDETYAQTVPIMVRMDSDRRLQEYIRGDAGGSWIEGVNLMRTPDRILNFEELFAKEQDEAAKQCNAYYAKMTFDAQGPAGPQGEADRQAAWASLTLFRRNANRAAAAHSGVLRDVLDCSLGERKAAVMDSLFEGDNALIRYDDGVWRFAQTDEAFVRRVLRDDEAFAREMLKTEHRRWCYYMASIGWEPPAHNERGARKDDGLCTNPCLVPWSDLLHLQQESCKYDLMPLMAVYEAMKAGN